MKRVTRVLAALGLGLVLTIGAAGVADAAPTYPVPNPPGNPPSTPQAVPPQRTVSTGGGALPRTGSDAFQFAMAGTAAVAIGSGLVIVSRRRRSVAVPA